MKRLVGGLLLVSCGLFAAQVRATPASPVSVEIVAPDGSSFREFPMNSRDGALRSYLQAEKGARYEVRVRNTSGERLGLVIAVDGRNIINGKRSELARTEPMYVLDAWNTQEFAGWRASLDAINEFYFTDWKDSYAEAFGDRSARGVIAIAVYREMPPPPPVYRPYSERQSGAADSAAAGASPPSEVARGEAGSEAARSRDKSAGTGYGDRRVDHVVQVEFMARSAPESKHFIKYEWRETLCRKHVLDCDSQNRFWDESVLGFAPPPPGRR